MQRVWMPALPASGLLFPIPWRRRHTQLVQSADPNLRLVSSFLDYLKVEKGLAPLSVAAYQSDMEQYSAFLLKRKRALRDARRQDVRDFLNSLLSNGLDGRSVARKLSALRHFYKYLLLDRYIQADPTLNIDTPRQWKVLPKSLAADEIEQVLQGPPRARDDRMSQALTRTRPGDAGSFLRRSAARVRSHHVETRRLKAGNGLRAGARQGRQGAHRSAWGRRRKTLCSNILADARPVLAAGKSSPMLFIARGAKSITRQRVWQMVNDGFGAVDGTPVRTCCGTVAPRIWLKMGQICVRCRQFWGTPTFRPRRFIRTWRWTG